VRIVYGGDEAFPPHEFLDEQGEPQGFNVELIRLLAEVAGVEVDVQLGVWTDILDRLDSGDVDVASLAVTEDRRQRYAFLVKTWTLRRGILFRSGRESYPTSLEGLSGEVVAAEAGGVVAIKIGEMPAETRPILRPASSHLAACQMLMRGEVTAASGSQLSLRYYAAKLGLRDLVEVQTESRGYYLTSRLDRAQELSFLIDAFQQVDSTDRFNRLVERSLAVPGASPTWREYRPQLFLALGTAVFVIVGIVAWNRSLRAQVFARTRELTQSLSEKDELTRGLRESERRRMQSEKLAVLGNVVGGVAHEVRSPLFAISANVDVLQRKLGRHPESEPYVAALRVGVERLSALMEDLLHYGRPEPEALRPGRVEAIVAQAVSEVATLARDKGVRLETKLSGDPPDVRLDPQRLGRALRNLVENAVQHSEPGGAVQLRIASASGESRGVEVCVEDSGPGFPPETLDRVFEPFFSLRRGGTGLGLAIVERVVHGHGGSVRAYNSEAGGAGVRLTLPGA
jgi:signal transduction histidine kinase